MVKLYGGSETQAMRKCAECEEEKLETEFSASQLARNYCICRTCNTALAREYREKNSERLKEYDKQRHKIYYEINKDDILEKAKNYHNEHKSEKQEYNKKYYEEHKETILAQSKEYQEANAEHVRKYHNERNKQLRKNNPTFRIRSAVSAAIGFYLKANGTTKQGKSCIKYLPYTIDELKQHIENQWEPWMNWENYGKYDPKTWDDNDSLTWTWQIDHIVPQSTFNYTSMDSDEFKKCWSLENLRPYPSKHNFYEGVRRTRH